MKEKEDNSAGAVLIVAPVGDDDQLAADLLSGAGIASKICAGIAQAAAPSAKARVRFSSKEEALEAAELPSFLSALQQQPPWSDIPVVLLPAWRGAKS